MSSDVTVRSSPIHGLGVFTTRGFAPGDRVLAIDDSRVVTDEHLLDPSKGELEHHRDYLGDRDVLMQEPERYINHACEPNTYVRTIDGVRLVVAYREIATGDEITYDYCINSYGDSTWECACGDPECRKLHHTDFFRLPREKLAEYLPLLDTWFVEWKRDEVAAARSALAIR